MALTPIVKPRFPNVPNLPGVPSLPRSPNFPPAVQAVVGYVEGKLWQALKGQQKWGIYKMGVTDSPYIEADSVIDMSYRNESEVANFPTQDGAFANYNKVDNPYTAYVRLVKGSGLSLFGQSAEDARSAFLNAIEIAANSLDLFNVVTPEKSYINANITGFDYRRSTEGGANMLIVDISLIEVRTVASQYSSTAPATANAQDPSAASPQNNGKVQALSTPQSLLSQAMGYLGVSK